MRKQFIYLFVLLFNIIFKLQVIYKKLNIEAENLFTVINSKSTTG